MYCVTHFAARRFILNSPLFMCCVVRFVARRSILILDYLMCGRRTFSRATFRFKFSLDDVCRRALRRATLDVVFIISSSVSWRAPSRDESIYS
jgi:hypothetical protein